MHLNARLAAVRVKTIVYIRFYLAVPSENRYIKENSANIPPWVWEKTMLWKPSDLVTSRSFPVTGQFKAHLSSIFKHPANWKRSSTLGIQGGYSSIGKHSGVDCLVFIPLKGFLTDCVCLGGMERSPSGHGNGLLVLERYWESFGINWPGWRNGA